MVVDGVPGQAKAFRELLTVGRALPEVAEDLKPGGVPQKVQALADMFPGAGRHLLLLPHELLHQSAVENGAVRSCFEKQVGAGIDKQGADGILRAGGQLEDAVFPEVTLHLR